MRSAVHPAIPVGDLAAARRSSCDVLGVEEGRSTEHWDALADRLRAAGVEPCRRFPGEPAGQWTMFLRDPAGNALEFKAFRDGSKVFAR